MSADSKVNKIEKRKIEFPHVLVLLITMIIISTILTYVIPAGQYERVLNEATGRTVIAPDSFTYIQNTPVGLFRMLVSIEEGLIAAAPITFMIFMAFASLYVIETTGAIDASIVSMTKRIEKNPKTANIMIAIIMTVISFWASTGTLSYEEILAFIPVFITLSIALGYDALVGVGMSFVSVGIGFAAATINPFTVGVAQGISELPMFSGIGLRFAVLCVMNAVTIFYVLRYANRVKKDPSRSLIADCDFSEFKIAGDRLNTEFTTKRKLTLVALVVGIAIMAYGLIKLHWYINEIAAIFFAITIVVGIINRWKLNELANRFVMGLSKGVLSALVVGFARGVLVVLNKGHIVDTIVHSATEVLQQLNLYLSGIGMLIFQTILNFLIPSGSGQAAVSMPIMAPLADLIGMNRQIAVLIFQFGDGFSNLIWPTGFLLIGCAIGKIPLNKYYRWFLPLFGICFIIQICFIFLAISIGYGPF